jgi:hypothetical protein
MRWLARDGGNGGDGQMTRSHVELAAAGLASERLEVASVVRLVVVRGGYS